MFVTYSHPADNTGTRFQQLWSDPLPSWAVDVKKQPAAEIRVILHTENGDVVTAYPAAMASSAHAHFMEYVTTGKKASMTNTD